MSRSTDKPKEPLVESGGIKGGDRVRLPAPEELAPRWTFVYGAGLAAGASVVQVVLVQRDAPRQRRCLRS